MKRKKPLTKKQNLVKNLIILGAITGLIATGYVLLINNVLLDYQNMPYIEFSYSDEPGVKKEVTIEKVHETTNYPSSFRIPNRLNGYPVTKIADEAFINLDRLVSVSFPESLKEIGARAFYNCPKLKSIGKIPSKLTYIGDEAFEETRFIEEQPAGPFEIGNILYKYVGELESKTAIVPNSSVTVPGAEHYIYLDNFAQIGSGAFKNKANLFYVEHTSKFTEMANHIFEGCYNLVDVVLNDNLVSIGDYAFSQCSKLTNVNLDNLESLTSIGDYAFNNTKLSGELTLSNSITSLGQYSFARTSSLEKVVFPNGLTSIPVGVLSGSNVSDIEFSGENLTDSKIGTIGAGAFARTKITSITVPFSVTSLSQSLFDGCSELESVYLYDNTTHTLKPGSEILTYQGVSAIQENVFANTPKLSSIITIDKDGNNTSDVGEVIFPESTIKFIEKAAFSHSGITKVTIPSTISEIKDNCFEYCENLVDLNFNINSELPKLNKIGTNAFQNCTALTSVTIPLGVSSISAGTFKNCTALEEVHFVGMKSSDYDIFGKDKSSRTFTFFSANLFENCTSLEHVDVPETVVSFKKYSFKNTAIKSIILPDSINNLDEYIFVGCPNDLVIFASDKIDFNRTAIKKKWNNKNETDDTKFITAIYSETEPTTGGYYWHYVDDVPTLWNNN